MFDTSVENRSIYLHASVHICYSVCPNSLILRYKVSSKLGARYNQSYAKNKGFKKKQQGNDHADTEHRG